VIRLFDESYYSFFFDNKFEPDALANRHFYAATAGVVVEQSQWLVKLQLCHFYIGF